MYCLKDHLKRAALNGLYYSKLDKLLAPKTSGQGIIFTLHQVEPKPCNGFAPNSILKITPHFLEQTIKTVQASGYEIISLDEMQETLIRPDQGKPFAVFTFDDGYRDNRDYALKIFEKYNIPLTIYIVSDYSSGKGELWWLALEDIIKQNSSVQDPFVPGKIYKTQTQAQKYKTFDELYWQLRMMNQYQQREKIKDFAKSHNFDIAKLPNDLIMNWDELRELNQHPLVTLGAHTKSHFALGLLDREQAKQEIVSGLEMMSDQLGQAPTHFAYPYGDDTSAGLRDFELVGELNFKTAVTTRKGVLYENHKNHLTALPRVSLNGHYQKARYVETFMSGLPFYISNGFKHMNVT